MDRGIPLMFFSYGGWFGGQASGHDSKNVELRLAQYAAIQNREHCLKLRGLAASRRIPDPSPLVRPRPRSLGSATARPTRSGASTGRATLQAVLELLRARISPFARQGVLADRAC